MNKIPIRLIKGKEYVLHYHDDAPSLAVFIGQMKLDNGRNNRYIFDIAGLDEVVCLRKHQLLELIDYNHYEIEAIDTNEKSSNDESVTAYCALNFSPPGITIYSKCCQAKYILSEGEEDTNCYLCTECGNGCDPLTQQVIDSITQTNEKIIGEINGS